MRKYAIFLFIGILSFVCAQKAGAQSGQAKTSPTSKAKPADKAAVSKSDKSAKDKDQAGKDKDAAQNKKDDKEAKKDKDEDSAESRDPMSSGTFGGLKFRSVGPAMISGRVVSIAVNPHNKSQYFIGVASGGVWRTDNDGTTWQPVFEHEGSYSIG